MKFNFNSIFHSSATGVDCVVGSSTYCRSTPVSPPPCRLGIILNAKWNKKGFTLLEMLVVLILAAMVGTLVFVRVGKSMTSRQTKVFTQELISLCKEARRMAMEKGEPTSVDISSEQRRCSFSGSKKVLAIPAEMAIEGTGIGRLEEDVYAIYFYPDGSSGGGELILSIPGQKIYSFRIDMLTGLLSRTGEHG